MYSFRTTFATARGPVDLAFTDRFGGVSAAPYDELNLALVGGDAPAAVTENLRRVVTDFAPGAALAPAMRQVHGNIVTYADRAAAAVPADADGQVSDDADLVLVVRVADCVPVLLADADSGVIGVAHAGRGGLVLGVVSKVVERLRDLGGRDLHAWIGPHVCGSCYEVPADLQEEVIAVEPASTATTSWGTPALDIGAGVRAQLERAGVAVATDAVRCTRESPDLYSYRRDGDRAGRLAGLVRLRGAS